MKKRLSVALLLPMLCIGVTSCQKEEIKNFQNISQQMSHYRSVYYSIDGVTFHTSFNNDDSWNQFISSMLALAREGHQVSFRTANSNSQSLTKETHTFTTSNPEEAQVWCDQMSAQGYSVDIKYDKTTGIYTCTATK